MAALERAVGATLPQAFRDFLAVGNGGHLEYVVDVRMPDGTVEEMCFGSIFSTHVGPRHRETFADELCRARECMKIPPGVLPFARDGGGSMVFLDLSLPGRGEVVAFVEGLPAWTGRRVESAFIEVAPSFDQYVDKLRIDREALLDTLENDTTDLSQVIATEEWLDIGLPEWRDDAEIMRYVTAAKQRLTIT